MSSPLFEARLRAQRFQYRDGLGEIAVGIVSLLTTGFNLTLGAGNSNSSWRSAAVLIYLLLLWVLVFFAPRIMGAIRERLMYPRSGYVNYGGFWRNHRFVVAMVLALLTVVADMLVVHYLGRAGRWNTAWWIQWIPNWPVPAVSGIMIGAVLAYVGVRQGLLRFLVVSVFSSILGVVVSIEYSRRSAFEIYVVGIGCALLCSGGIALWRYLHTTPPTQHEA